jgi:hypothetical protein
MMEGRRILALLGLRDEPTDAAEPVTDAGVER